MTTAACCRILQCSLVALLCLMSANLLELDVKLKNVCFLDADCLVVGKASKVLGVEPGNTL